MISGVTERLSDGMRPAAFAGVAGVAAGVAGEVAQAASGSCDRHGRLIGRLDHAGGL